ncbi:hypothetical protein KFL_001850220 [Klebsormidium nitens]|uniref:Uncharacterized protein n=1 Tax=Klebsormidium nitens TaxID=105231 RepID=A0A1Y1I8B9_KLENI|nr:hypothetical protein KFL_001850220 [Klebsormidium nitens]|eukprot:GAQ84348.1 hypothetical protein KFL_001850220 [Klebsormidium nitens]
MKLRVIQRQLQSLSLRRALEAEAARKTKAEAAARQARSEKNVLQARVTSLSKDLAKAQSDLKEARSENEVLEARLSALETVTAEKEREGKQRVSALEESLKGFREAGGRCAKERERFCYVLASNGQEGSVPWSALASDPESLLHKMYCGEWDYARDEKGRALVTCHPQRWAAIIEHLATGAVPAEWDPQLLAQARHWNLQRLVEGLEASIPGMTVTADPDSKGFKVRCVFASVMKELSSGEKLMKYTFSGPQKRWWAVKLTEKGICLGAVAPPHAGSSKVSGLREISAVLTFRVVLRNGDMVKKSADPVLFSAGKEEDRGFFWQRWEHDFHHCLLVQVAASNKQSAVAKAQRLRSAENAELEALRTAVGSSRKALDAEVTRATEAEAAAKQAQSENEALQARVTSLSKELAKAQSDVNELRSENEVLQATLSALETEGSVPWSVLAFDPESLLYKMYCGEWDYARDEKGRALVTCHPQRWAAIIEHLATGAVPAEWDAQLLAQARHWNLRRLVEGLEASIPGVTVTADSDSKGFKARCVFVSVMKGLSSGEKIASLDERGS